MGSICYYIFSSKIQGRVRYDFRYESANVTPSVCKAIIEELNGTIHYQGLFEFKENNNPLGILERIVRDANEHNNLDLTTLDKVA